MERVEEVMPKSRSKRRRVRSRDSANTRPAAKPRKRRILWGVSLVAAVIAGAAAWFAYESRGIEEAFLDHARRGRASLDKVERSANQGGGHLSPGESIRYLGDPPTSGRHDLKWVDPGVYDTVQRREKLVHSLEHGMIVIYYDTPKAAAFETLKQWADLYGGAWSGLVLTRKPGLGASIVLTAWNRVLRLKTFDADAAAAFIDAYRGRGPEKTVR